MFHSYHNLLFPFSFVTSEYVKSNIAIGLESTLRRVKQAKADTIVIADEISPRWFAKHLIAMALHRNQETKVVIVPKLKDITKTLLGVPAIIFSMKSPEVKSFYDELAMHSTLLKHYYTVKPSINVSLKKKKTKSADEPHPVTLLTKPSDSSRAFIPMDLATPAKPSKPTNDFIAFSKEVNTLPEPSLYRPIMIRKIVGNPKRKKI